MSLFESASLVVTPNGTKASKLYAIKPTSGAGDLSVTRATTATRVNSAGLIESVAVNVPRLDYTNSTCPSILVEPQRTNLLTYSEDFSNVGWLKFNSNVTANTAVSPDGNTTADTLNVTSTGGKLYRAFVSTAQSYTLSVFIKKGSTSSAFLNFYNGAIADYVCETDFNLINGTFTGASGGSAFIQNYNNDYWRIGISYTLGIGVSEISIGLTRTSTASSYIWGAQLEAGSYPTSYIPTVASAVTRNADVISKTGISSLIGQTEGTILFDGKINGCENPSANLINTEKNVITSFAISYIKATKKISASIFDNGTEKGIINGGPYELGERVKVAYAYKSGNFALYINGNLIGTSASSFTFPNTIDDIFIGDVGTYFAYQESISNNTSALWKTRLTNAELAELTTI